MAFLRLIVFGFLVLSVIYLAVSWYMRSTTREELEKDWAEEHPGDDDSPERAAHITAGMAAYQKGIRPKLVLLVYIIPAIAIAAIMILTNAY